MTVNFNCYDNNRYITGIEFENLKSAFARGAIEYLKNLDIHEARGKRAVITFTNIVNNKEYRDDPDYIERICSDNEFVEMMEFLESIEIVGVIDFLVGSNTYGKWNPDQCYKMYAALKRIMSCVDEDYVNKYFNILDNNNNLMILIHLSILSETPLILTIV